MAKQMSGEEVLKLQEQLLKLKSDLTSTQEKLKEKSAIVATSVTLETFDSVEADANVDNKELFALVDKVCFTYAFSGYNPGIVAGLMKAKAATSPGRNWVNDIGCLMGFYGSRGTRVLQEKMTAEGFAHIMEIVKFYGITLGQPKTPTDITIARAVGVIPHLIVKFMHTSKHARVVGVKSPLIPKWMCCSQAGALIPADWVYEYDAWILYSEIFSDVIKNPLKEYTYCNAVYGSSWVSQENRKNQLRRIGITPTLPGHISSDLLTDIVKQCAALKLYEEEEATPAKPKENKPKYTFKVVVDKLDLKIVTMLWYEKGLWVTREEWVSRKWIKDMERNELQDGSIALSTKGYVANVRLYIKEKEKKRKTVEVVEVTPEKVDEKEDSDDDDQVGGATGGHDPISTEKMTPDEHQADEEEKEEEKDEGREKADIVDCGSTSILEQSFINLVPPAVIESIPPPVPSKTPLVSPSASVSKMLKERQRAKHAAAQMTQQQIDDALKKLSSAQQGATLDWSEQ